MNSKVGVDERLLSNLRPSENGSVVRVEGPDDVRRCLVEMGIVPGVTVEVIGTASLGDPLEVSLRDRLPSGARRPSA